LLTIGTELLSSAFGAHRFGLGWFLHFRVLYFPTLSRMGLTISCNRLRSERRQHPHPITMTPFHVSIPYWFSVLPSTTYKETHYVSAPTHSRSVEHPCIHGSNGIALGNPLRLTQMCRTYRRHTVDLTHSVRGKFNDFQGRGIHSMAKDKPAIILRFNQSPDQKRPAYNQAREGPSTTFGGFMKSVCN
jgi:hypothetical protein